MARTHNAGRSFEHHAALSLQSRGWQILQRNYRAGPREIDLIARRGEVVAFVEVKGRTTSTHHHPLEAIGPAKRRDLARAARCWIGSFGRRGEVYRFDAIAVIGPADAPVVIEHVEDAWRI